MVVSSATLPHRVCRLGVAPSMLVDDQFMQTVSFLCVDRQTDHGRDRVPAATAFYVSVPIGDDLEQDYAVTARHVIDTSRTYGDLYLRMRLLGHRSQDILVPQDKWVCHQRADVAVIPVEIPDDWAGKFIPIDMLATEEDVRSGNVGIGDEVFFVGLFSEFSGRGRDTPVARFGRVSLMHQEMPLTLSPETDPTMTDAYLIETVSWGGESGSPAFVYHGIDREPGVVMVGGARFFLLGLAHGHFPIEREVRFRGDILGSGAVSINAGMAVVIPAQMIRETLMTEELVRDRERDSDAHRKNP